MSLRLAQAAVAVAWIAVIGAPLRAAAGRPMRAERVQDDAPERAELEAERETKYREIRDAELDFRTGKLSADDYAAIDTALRAEALGILNRLEALGVDREPGAARPGAALPGLPLPGPPRPASARDAESAPSRPADGAEPEVEP